MYIFESSSPLWPNHLGVVLGLGFLFTSLANSSISTERFRRTFVYSIIIKCTDASVRYSKEGMANLSSCKSFSG